MSEVAETIAMQIVEFVQHVRATCRLTDGVYRSPTGPYGLRRQWLPIEWLAAVLEKQVREGGHIEVRTIFPGWGMYSPWPKGRAESPDEHWDHCEFMPHMHRPSAAANPDGPAATGLVEPFGTIPTTGEGQRRLNVLLSLMDCPIRDSGISVEELDRVDAMVWELEHDLAKIDDRPPTDLIHHKEAAEIVKCDIKTMRSWIEAGKLRFWGPDKQVSRNEVNTKLEAGELYKRPRQSVS